MTLVREDPARHVQSRFGAPRSEVARGEQDFEVVVRADCIVINALDRLTSRTFGEQNAINRVASAAAARFHIARQPRWHLAVFADQLAHPVLHGKVADAETVDPGVPLHNLPVVASGVERLQRVRRALMGEIDQRIVHLGSAQQQPAARRAAVIAEPHFVVGNAVDAVCVYGLDVENRFFSEFIRSSIKRKKFRHPLHDETRRLMADRPAPCPSGKAEDNDNERAQRCGADCCG